MRGSFNIASMLLIALQPGSTAIRWFVTTSIYLLGPAGTIMPAATYSGYTSDLLLYTCRLSCCRSLTLADPWQPTVSLPTQALQQLTYLSFLAEGLLMTNLASQFCEALVKLKQLEELQLSRLQVSSSAAQMLAHALTELPFLNKLVLTGGAAPMHAPELYVLLNGRSICSFGMTLLSLGTGICAACCSWHKCGNGGS